MVAVLWINLILYSCVTMVTAVDMANKLEPYETAYNYFKENKGLIRTLSVWTKVTLLSFPLYYLSKYMGVS